MAVYEYEGLDARGKAAHGIIDAETPRAARAKLKADGIFATALEPARQEAAVEGERSSPALFQRGLSTSELALLTRQLATLIDAGLPLVSALGSILEQTETARTRRVLSQVRERVSHVHLANFNGREHRRLQDGHLPLAELLGELRDDGYRGVIVVELEPSALDVEDEAQVLAQLKAQVAFCRQHFES